MKPYVPIEFGRRPRSLRELDRWKATEFRFTFHWPCGAGGIPEQEHVSQFYAPVNCHFHFGKPWPLKPYRLCWTTTKIFCEALFTMSNVWSRWGQRGDQSVFGAGAQVWSHREIWENFLAKLAYLSDIFGKLNELNLQLQGKDKHLPLVTDKITSFTQKLTMWGRRLDEGSTDSFENLQEFIDASDYDAISVMPHIKQHISSLLEYFKKYFPENSSQYDWVRDPFNAPAPTSFSSAEEDQFIDMSSDFTLRLRFTSQTLSEFWLSVERPFFLRGA